MYGGAWDAFWKEGLGVTYDISKKLGRKVEVARIEVEDIPRAKFRGSRGTFSPAQASLPPPASWERINSVGQWIFGISTGAGFILVRIDSIPASNLTYLQEIQCSDGLVSQLSQRPQAYCLSRSIYCLCFGYMSVQRAIQGYRHFSPRQSSPIQATIDPDELERDSMIILGIANHIRNDGSVHIYTIPPNPCLNPPSFSIPVRQ
jgi:hypothetical protein